MNEEVDLTICTVSYGHKKLLEKNIQFFSKFNPEYKVCWIVVDNKREGLKFNKKEIQVIEGDAPVKKPIAQSSFHHGSGLNKAVKEVQTKFALIMDPDFFIIRPNWASDVIDHMKKNDLAFFGAPYNPKRYLKYRYFPCIHCMFIDLDKIKKEELNYLPQYV